MTSVILQPTSSCLDLCVGEQGGEMRVKLGGLHFLRITSHFYTHYMAYIASLKLSFTPHIPLYAVKVLYRLPWRLYKWTLIPSL